MGDLGEFRRWMASGKTDAERAAERRKELERQTQIRRARNERRNARRRARAAALGVPVSPESERKEMSDEIKGYDRSNTNRLVSVEGPRVRGTFSVLKAYPDREAWVTAHDVTVYWDDERSSGRILYSKDLTGSVKDGVARLEKHSVASNKLADVEQVWDEMLAALVVAVEAADFPVSSPERGE